MGAVGRALAPLLRPFGARILYTDTGAPDPVIGARPVHLPTLLAESDVVVPLVPLTAGTHHLLDAAAIAAMRPGAYIVNVGRGSVVDEEAVADALETRHLAGYAADVFAMEDWARPDRPAHIPSRLLRHPRTLLTPHLGTAVDDVRYQMSLAAARQVEEALAGRRPEYALNEVVR
jgi:phosphonate dehydrogenase